MESAKIRGEGEAPVWERVETTSASGLYHQEAGETTHSIAAGDRSESPLPPDFSALLEKLGRFRKRADYLSYNMDERSTHYNRPNLLDCLAQLDALRQEIEGLLKAQGRL